MWQLGFEQIVTTIPRRLIDTCRYVDFTRDEWCLVFYPCLKGKVRIRSSSRISSWHFDPRESLLIKGQSISASHACGRFQSAHAPSALRRVDRDHCFCATIGRVWDDDWETPRDIPRINALRSTSERPSIPAVRPALRNHHSPSVAERRCGFRWVPVRCLVQVEPAEY